MTSRSEHSGGFWTSLTGILTASGTFIGAVATILALLAANHLWPFPPEAKPERPKGIVSASPTSQSFGDVQRGQSGEAQTVTVTNGRNDTVTLGVAIKGDGAASFSLAVDTCSELPVDATKTCDLIIVFSPTATGLLGARLEVSAPGEVTTVALSGNGKAAGALSFEPPAGLNFDLYTTTSGTPSSASAPLTIRNTGGSTLKINTVKAGDSHFTPASTCNGTTLAPNELCEVKVTFASTANGKFQTKLTVDTTNGKFEISLLGYRGPRAVIKLPPGIVINPTILPVVPSP